MDELVERLRGHAEIMERDKGKFVRFIDVATCTQAANRIEAQAAEIRSLREQVAKERAGIVAWLRDTSERGPKPRHILDLHDANDLADAIEHHEDKETRA